VTVKFMAIFGLAALSIAGALGDALAYGPDIDPLARWAFDLVASFIN